MSKETQIARSLAPLQVKLSILPEYLQVGDLHPAKY